MNQVFACVLIVILKPYSSLKTIIKTIDYHSLYGKPSLKLYVSHKTKKRSNIACLLARLQAQQSFSTSCHASAAEEHKLHAPKTTALSPGITGCAGARPESWNILDICVELMQHQMSRANKHWFHS